MRIRDVAVLMLLLPTLARAGDAAPTDTSMDTFGQLLAKQQQLIESEMDAKIRANQAQATGAPAPTAATPLPGVKQDVNDKEPTVEAIWGLVGKEVAEVNYKGRSIPVSMQEPYISKIDGWKLESIQPYAIVLVRMSGNRVIQRKSVMLDWQGSGGSEVATSSPAMPSMRSMPIVPRPMAAPAAVR
ncbi:hypothetical protein [Trinickia dinghuensis]|uniref:Type IV pilus biogenesis protein PilP n=1 Tax=Trinickia dinghuensis TaxID=2291023 RepID=A0A3D8K1N4_9BURK|nr:hypothetical protein [Trinickia dinghuensis]RDU98745.1 hypothetical protein DWV00_10780 [Trinickia dinghuensis]